MEHHATPEPQKPCCACGAPLAVDLPTCLFCWIHDTATEETEDSEYWNYPEQHYEND